MNLIKVNLGDRAYDIHIGKNVIKKLPALIKPTASDTPMFVVTQKKINKLHGRKLAAILRPLSKKVLFYEVPDSEKAKSFPIYIKTIRSLARFAKKTKPLVLALGGGVVGDLAGFVASAYTRGVPYIQIPTTLLGQVDSAIGGKVAIDIKEAKNIVGNFYQPKMVICDINFLKTLPEKELRNGLVEIVKYGIIKDRSLFEYLEKNLRRVLKRSESALEYVITRSCGIKARVVEEDEFDTKGLRAILNFGHTLGHAIEAASRYSQSVTHGRAVASGMVMASLIALKRKMITKKDHERICKLIKKITSKTKIKKMKRKNILTALSFDKKFVYGVNRFILPKRIGIAQIVDNIPEALIKEVIEKASI